MTSGPENHAVPLEIETNMPCPACGSNLFMIVYETEIPYEGNIIIQTDMCKKCFYKNSSIQRLADLSPIETSFTVENESDLNVVVYRSPNAKVVIPEMGVEIEPGSASSGDITTVEGLLSAVRDQMIFISDDPEDEKKFNEILKVLDSVLRGEGPAITLSIEDDTGISRIASHKARIIALDHGRDSSI